MNCCVFLTFEISLFIQNHCRWLSSPPCHSALPCHWSSPQRTSQKLAPVQGFSVLYFHCKLGKGKVHSVSCNLHFKPLNITIYIYKTFKYFLSISLLGIRFFWLFLFLCLLDIYFPFCSFLQC